MIQFKQEKKNNNINTTKQIFIFLLVFFDV